MVWVWRACLGLLIAAYAVWLAWPLVQPVVEGAPLAGVATALAAEAARTGWLVPTLWLGSAILYLVAAILTAAGIGAAPWPYFLAFLGELMQRLVLQSATEAALADTPARIEAGLRLVNLSADPGPLSLATLLAGGLLVLMTGVWRGQTGQALTRHWTRPPLYG